MLFDPPPAQIFESALFIRVPAAADSRTQPKHLEKLNPTPKGSKLARFNRLLLADAYPKQMDTEPKTEMNWLATSRTPDQMGAEAFLGNNRQYWDIENGTHQRLDCSALEDRLRIHEPNAVEILGFFHRVSISLFMAWADQAAQSARPHLSDLASRSPSQSLDHDPPSHQTPT